MEYAEKMYLVPQHQLDRMKTENPRESIQQTVENELDGSMRNILLRTDLSPYEKAKLYANTLSRFLNVVKQGDREAGVLTLTLPDPPNKDELPTTTAVEDDGADVHVMDEVLKNVPSRSVKNSRYILDKMSKAKELSAWNESGEFVFRGKAVKGSHMLDLLKNITAPQKVRDNRRPIGWSEFLRAFAELNIPFSTVPNQQVRGAIQSLKSKPDSPAQTLARPSKRGRKYSRSVFPEPEDSVFKSPTIDRRQWLEF